MYQIKNQDGTYFYHHLDLKSGQMMDGRFESRNEASFVRTLNGYNKMYIKDQSNCLIWPIYEKIEK